MTCAPAAAQTGLSADMSGLSPSVMNAGGTATVTITLGNGTPSAVSNLGDTVVMPTGITVTTPAPTTNCPDGAMSTIGSNTVRIAGASLDSSDICTFTFRITSSTPGEYTLNPGTPSATGVSGHAGTTFPFIVNSTSPPTLHDFTASAVAYNSTGTSINVATGTTPTDSPTSWGVTTTLGGAQSAGPLTTANGGTVSINTSSGVATYAAPTGFRGNDTFFVGASNGNGPSNGATVTVPVNNPTLVANLSATSAPAGVPLSGVAINVTGGRAAYSCAATPASGSLPPGVTIAADCTLTGTPSVAGPYNFTATITDSSVGTGPYTQASGTLTLTIQPGALVVTSGPASGTQVGASYSQVNSASGGTAPYTYGLASGALPAGVALNTNTGLVSGTPSAAGAFTYVVKATDSQGTPATANGTPVTGTIAKGAQTISFTGPPTTPLSASTVSVSATATSGLGVTFTSTTTPVCTVAGTTVTLLTTGTCTIAADQAGNANTNAAPQVIRSFTVSAATLVVTAGAASGTQVAAGYSQANPASGGTAPYTYAVASGTVPAGTTLNTGTGLVSGTPTTAGAFTYAIKATDSQGTPATATGATVTGAIAKGAQTISFTGPPTTPLSASTVSVSATTTSGLGVTFTSTTTPVCTVAGTTVTLLTAGTCTIAADQAGNANYNAAPQVTQSFTVSAATLVVAAGAASGTQVAASYGQANPASGGIAPYTYAVASGTLPAGTTLNTGTGLVSGTPTTAGSFTYAIKATDSQGTPATATGATVSGTIAKGTQTISFTGPPTTPLAAATVSVSATSTSGLGVTFTSTTTSVCTVVGTTVTLLTAGTCSIAADQAGNANYNAAPQVAQSFTVSAATLVVAAGAASGTQVAASYSQANPASGGIAPYTYTLASGALPAGTTLNGSTGLVSGTPTTAGAFSYAIKATDSQGPPATATGATVSGTIAKGAQTISFTGPPATPLSASPVSLTATATSGLAVTFTSTTTSVCTVSANAVTLLTTGTCTIAADQAGNANINAALQVVQSFTVNAAMLVVTAGAASGTQVAASYSQNNPASGGTAPYTYALASGALPAGTSLNTGTGVVSGTPTAAGAFTYAIKATDSQGPPATATGATVSGTIAKGAQTISFTAPPTTFVSASPVSISATSTSGLTVAFISTTSAVCAVSGTSVILLTAGTCSIAADQAGDTNWSAAPQVVRSFTVNASPVFVFTPPAGVLPGGVVATSYSQTIGTSGGTGPYTYSITSGALPGGLSLNTSTGAISGSPTAAGSFSFTVSARDTNNQTGSVAYTLGVTAPSVIAVSSNVSVIAGTTFTVDLTAGAVGGPFTSAQLISLSPPSAGSALITLGDTASNSDTVVAALVAGGRYLLKFTSAATFTGTAVASFTLSSAFGTSAPATITFSVSPRPDPSKDTEVLGVVNAQAQAAQHFASTQIMNFNDRLERLHDNGCHQNSFNLSLSDNRYQRDADPLQRAGINSTKPPGNKDFDKLWGSDTASRDGSGNVSATGLGTGNTSASASGSGNASLPGLGVAPDSRSAGSRDAVGRAGKRDNPTGCGDEAVQRFAAWTGGAVTFGRLSNTAGTGASYVSTGVSAGVDYWFSPAFIGGVGFGYGQDRSAIGTSGTISNATGYSAAVYGSWHPSRSTFVDAVLGYGLLNFSSSRYITGSNGEFADGRRNGHQIFGSLTSGYEYKANGLLVSPYARVSASWSTLEAFTENSGGAFALQYGSQTINSLTAGLGLRALYEIRQPWGAITPRMRIEYAHEFDGVSRTTVGYADISSSSYLLQIAPTGSDYVITGLGSDLSFAGGWTLGLDYRTAFGQGKSPPQTLQMKLDARF